MNDLITISKDISIDATAANNREIPQLQVPELASADRENIFPAFFYDVRGRRSNDEWLAYSLLDDLANLRIMSAGQLVRWIRINGKSKNDDTVSTFIAELFRHQLVEKTTIKIPLPQSKRVRQEEYQTQNVSIIYLTENCRTILRVSHSANFARYGCPDKTRLDRAYHDLLITESVLTLAAHYRVWWIKSEDILKSELPAATAVEAGSRSVPDFKVWLEKSDEEGQITFFDCVSGEVIVQSDMAQIAAKPKDSIFFTQNLRAADLIKTTTGKNAVILSDAAFPDDGEALVNRAWEEIFDPHQALWRRRLKLLYQNQMQSGGHYYGIMHHLHRQGPLTATALSELTDVNRAEISRNLQKMTAQKMLHFEDIQSAPGAQVGRPSRLFAFIDTSLSDYEFRLNQLKISQLIERKSEKIAGLR